MQLRGRTVLALLLTTAFAASAATIVVLGLAGKADGLLRDAGSPPSEWDKLNRAAGLIADRSLYPIDRDKLVDSAIAGMVKSLNDPYAAYYSKEEAQQLSDSADEAFTGIGAKVDSQDGHLVVVRVLTGTPAERAGLRAGDMLLSVNGQTLEGVPLAEAASKVRGPKGTKAKLSVKRADAAEPIELELIRDRIAAETVSGELGPDGVGTLRIVKFDFDTSGLVSQELGKMEAGGMKALIVDLRDNPGGVLASAESVAGLLVPSGRTIAIEEDGKGHQETKKATGDLSGDRAYPIVVLINGGSASSAELVAGALKQSAGATLVGTRTHGKGAVQISFENELGDGSLLKLTVMKWLLPDGASVQDQGLAPDLEIEQLSQDPDNDTGNDIGSDPQEKAAREQALHLAASAGG